jgi:acetolactate decarboxylase
MNGKLAAALDLRTLASRQQLYGIGPIEQLRGEVTIADSRPALARVEPDGALKVTQSFDTGVPFFVWAEVPRWHQVQIPAEVRSFEDLESFVPKAAAAAGVDADKPLPFLVNGREQLIESRSSSVSAKTRSSLVLSCLLSQLWPRARVWCRAW